MGVWLVNVVPPRPRFDATLNWGHILTAATIVLGGLGVVVAGVIAFWSLKGEFQSSEARSSIRFDTVETSIKVMTTTLERLAEKSVIDAQQTERINSLDRRVDGNEKRIGRIEDRITTRP